MANRRTGKTASPTPKTKAQVRFEEFKARSGEARAAAAAAAAPMSPAAPGLRVGPAVPAWGFPPYAALPASGFPPFATAAPDTAADGSVGERLGSTLRLGVEVANAVLVNSLRLLHGLTGMTSELGGALWPQGQTGSCGGACGCGSCCGDPVTSCGCSDCCCLLGCGCGCCQPSVGACG
jgi:hypothetical protein